MASRYRGTRGLNGQTKLSAAIRQLAPRLWPSTERWGVQAQRMAEHICETLGDPMVGDIDQFAVDTLLDDLQERGVKPATKDRWLAVFGRLCRELHQRKALVEVPAFPTQDKRAGKQKRRSVLGPEELRQLDRTLREHLEASDVARVVDVLQATGMRLGELLSLEREQVERDRSGQAWVTLLGTKNGSDREIPVGEETYARLQELFEHGMPPRWRVQRKWQEARALMGRRLDPDFVIHILRHTAATRFANGMPLPVAQKMLGHDDIQTTMKYVHTTKRDLVRGLKALEAAGE